MLLMPAALASLRPYSRKASQQSTASTDPEGPTKRASFIAVSPKPQPASTTLSPGLTGRVGKMASLWSVKPSTRMCFQRTNFGTRTLFQKSMYWLCARCSGARASTVMTTSRKQTSLVFVRSERVQLLAYCSALITSMQTNGSLPSTHASWPGGIGEEAPGAIDFCEPSFIFTVSRPDTACPTWLTWQLSVPTTGLMHADHRQPGCIFKRPSVKPGRGTTSTP